MGMMVPIVTCRNCGDSYAVFPGEHDTGFCSLVCASTMPARVFRLRWEQLGGHVHCRLFEASHPSGTWACNGSVTFDHVSWPIFRKLLEMTNIEVIAENGPVESWPPSGPMGE